MSKLKMFYAPTVELPQAWVRRVNTQTHHTQGCVLVVAATKAAAVEMLEAAGTSDYSAGRVVAASRVQPADLPKIPTELVEAGVVDLEQPGAYAWRRDSDGSQIIRVDDKDLPYVGTFRNVTLIQDGRTTYRMKVEPFTSAPPAEPEQRITWNRSRYGTLRGTVGGIEIASISQSTRRGDNTQHLRTELPGYTSERAAEDAEAAQALAETILAEFVAKLGAEFPGAHR